MGRLILILEGTCRRECLFRTMLNIYDGAFLRKQLTDQDH